MAMSDPISSILLSLLFRLSPEHKFPIPLEDCLHAISFVIKYAEAYGIDANRLVTRVRA